MWRTLARGIGCGTYLATLVVVAGLSAYAAFSLFVRRGETIVPQLATLSEEEAVALAADQGLQLEWTDNERFDEEIPAGHVLIQEPRAGTLVKRGSAIAVTVSKGSQRVEIPAVLGQTLLAAQLRLEQAELRVGRTVEILTPQAAPGVVVLQRPLPDELAEPNAAVELALSSDAAGLIWVMPDLIDRSSERVRAFFEGRGFELGRIAYETYPGREAGTVLGQFPVAGHPIRQGDAISLTVVAPESTSLPSADEVPP